jgi:hypothetical protein
MNNMIAMIDETRYAEARLVDDHLSSGKRNEIDVFHYADKILRQFPFGLQSFPGQKILETPFPILLSDLLTCSSTAWTKL